MRLLRCLFPNIFTHSCDESRDFRAREFMSNVSSLSGVTVLSLILGTGIEVPQSHHLVDDSKDLSAVLYYGVPFLAILLGSIGFTTYRTDDDGYVYGKRCVESCYPRLRKFMTALIYILEGMHVVAVSFGKQGSVSLNGGALFYKIAHGWLWYGDLSTSFAACIVIQLFLMLFFIIPFILWLTLKRDSYTRFVEVFIAGKVGVFTGLMQDSFLLFLSLPMMIQFLRPVTCTYYFPPDPMQAPITNATGFYNETLFLELFALEQSTAMDETVRCDSYNHSVYKYFGIVMFLFTFATGVLSGCTPPLVVRGSDLALNGRYQSISFSLKAALAFVYVAAEERHRWYHLSITFFLQSLLLFISISMRPCLVERINFHRSAIFCVPVLCTVACAVASGLDDILNPIPILLLIASLTALGILLFQKYYVLVCHKLFPQIEFEEGLYEGDLSIGLNVPHGHGSITWGFDDRVFSGFFSFGKVNGFGVLTFGKKFYQGDHCNGRRHGFGMTNIMEMEDEESYEGFWVDDIPQGPGTKKFVDGDRFDGDFDGGFEHGEGKWTYETTLGKHVTTGTWDHGVFTDVVLEEGQEYDGEIRYSVPHGEGVMTIGEDRFEGEWRAGKMHGFGKIQMLEGTYEGHFQEGMYHDDGIWTDANGTYSGKFFQGLKHGHGREETDDGVFEGHMHEGTRGGYGSFTYCNGARYQGTWKNNEYHGTGTLTTEDYVYDGHWFNGQKHGIRGHIKFTNGIEYDGGWHEDQFNGEGRLFIPDFGEYRGCFIEGAKSKIGRFVFLDGSEYVGEWDLDLPHGQGHFTFVSRRAVLMLASMDTGEIDAKLLGMRHQHVFNNGGEYTGTFEDGYISGDGVMVLHDGSKYQGSFKMSEPSGNGTLEYGAGGRYEGEWVAGEREGQGKMTYPDNRVYVGEWVANRRHGRGKLFGSMGELISDCDWVGDLPVHARTIDVNLEQELPVLDVDEFLRDIMPGAASPEEVEELRFRKRVELEEVFGRLRIPILLDEQLTIIRLGKQLLGHRHLVFRKVMVQQQQLENEALQKATLAKVLNKWKEDFKGANNREPKKSDLMGNASISSVYKRYAELSKEKEGK